LVKIPDLSPKPYRSNVKLEFLDISWVMIQCIDRFSNLEQPASLLKREDLNKYCLRIVSALGEKHSVTQVLAHPKVGRHSVQYQRKPEKGKLSRSHSAI